MSVIFLLIPLSILIAACFLVGFIWAVRSGQYEDTCTPSMRLLLDDPAPKPETDNTFPTNEPENRK
ncbi:MAG TPA: cbb3-type cytochrome oxidase assembly protein CcoS [Terriglobales bacterium]|nr:cbb3-type cytochrome oxidase assembly protein CcoS [Terriglobales bacterium]